MTLPLYFIKACDADGWAVWAAHYHAPSKQDAIELAKEMRALDETHAKVCGFPHVDIASWEARTSTAYANAMNGPNGEVTREK